MKSILRIQRVFFIASILLVFMPYANAQTTADFEDYGLNAGEFNNNAMGDDFSNGNILLRNFFNTDFNSWNGWAISATTDVETPGYGNQYSSITGAGYDGSTTYAVSFQFSNTGLRLTGDASGGVAEGMYVTNGTYPYLSMRDGDDFAKRFGGELGDDPDYFLLTIKGSLDGVEVADSIDFYLADYRFEDNSMDYIVNEWSYIDLQSLGNVDSLTFTLSSTDVGEHGMNTPGYFCMDNFTTTDMMAVSTNDIAVETLELFPNPASEKINFQWTGENAATAKLFNAQGQLVQIASIFTGTNSIEVHQLATGVYSLVCENGEMVSVNRVVIE